MKVVSLYFCAQNDLAMLETKWVVSDGTRGDHGKAGQGRCIQCESMKAKICAHTKQSSWQAAVVVSGGVVIHMVLLVVVLVAAMIVT